MNDRAVGILDNYELQVLRTWKGRGAILCETDQGIRILKEHRGSQKRLEFMGILLKRIKENGFLFAEDILSNKEGELFCTDADRTIYIVKSYPDVRECNIREKTECLTAASQLAKLHQAMSLPDLESFFPITEYPLLYEIHKRNRELHKVRRFIKEKSQKTEFEIFLMQQYDYFYEEALLTEKELRMEPVEEWLSKIQTLGTFCHGDFQYHNIRMGEDACWIINFEKYSQDNPIKDFYLFSRKFLEKNNWNQEFFGELLQAYRTTRKVTEDDLRELFYRFRYPEKFWKIVNFYYNSSKAWISCKNREKLEKILEQEENRKSFLSFLESMD